MSKNAGSQELVEVLVRGVHHCSGLGEQRNLVGQFDPPGVEEHLLTVDDADFSSLQGCQDRHLDDVDTEGLLGHTRFFQLSVDLCSEPVGDLCLRIEGPAQGGDSGPGTAFQPGSSRPVMRGVWVRVDLHARF